MKDAPRPRGNAMIVHPAIEEYLHGIQPAPDAVLLEMEKVGIERGFPIIGPLVGRLCEQLARAISARTVFEMGSGFGYSTAWFARAVGAGGRVVHTDGDKAKSEEAKGWLARAKLAERVEFQVGDAVALIEKAKGPFDVVFVDIDKEQYPDAFLAAKDKVRVGGLIITDNVLWQGKVANRKAKDKATRGAREYTQLAMEEPGFLTTVLPLRDGVAVSLRLR
ncbi:MAG: O-methyltransferase [Thermoplasmatota archaeon]|nr:O-methyltransferase [Halobacteriales archaeon]